MKCIIFIGVVLTIAVQLSEQKPEPRHHRGVAEDLDRRHHRGVAEDLDRGWGVAEDLDRGRHRRGMAEDLDRGWGWAYKKKMMQKARG